jgi:hypothetical protein
MTSLDVLINKQPESGLYDRDSILDRGLVFPFATAVRRLLRPTQPAI